jgi:hypothetical protein
MVLTSSPPLDPACPQAGAFGNSCNKASKSSQVAKESGNEDHLRNSLITTRDNPALENSLRNLMLIKIIRKFSSYLLWWKHSLLELGYMKDWVDRSRRQLKLISNTANLGHNTIRTRIFESQLLICPWRQTKLNIGLQFQKHSVPHLKESSFRYDFYQLGTPYVLLHELYAVVTPDS